MPKKTTKGRKKKDYLTKSMEERATYKMTAEDEAWAADVTPDELERDGEMVYLTDANVNLPSLEQVMAHDEFRATLESDGLPTLYSRAPRWPWNFEHLRTLTARMGPDAALVNTFCQNAARQRQKDAAYKHVCLLLDRQGETIRSAREWSALVLAPAAVSVPASVITGTQMTAYDFMGLVQQHLEYAPFAGIHCPPEAKLCKHCKAITTCECACGENFCSRSCLKKEWKHHAPVCWMIYDNGLLAAAVHQRFEFATHERGPPGPPKRNKLSCTTCHKKGPKLKCSKCDVSYCSRYCQRLDWASHKLSCQGHGTSSQG